MMFVPHRKYTHVPRRSVTEIALLFICRWCSYLTRNTRAPPRLISGKDLLWILLYWKSKAYGPAQSPTGIPLPYNGLFIEKSFPSWTCASQVTLCLAYLCSSCNVVRMRVYSSLNIASASYRTSPLCHAWRHMGTYLIFRSLWGRRCAIINHDRNTARLIRQFTCS
jgi:hypothetical protein